jgi:GT2 family glycosyltransferase
VATYITTIDLDAPLHPIEVPAPAGGLLALLRRGGRPAGMLRLDGRHFTAAALRRAVAEQSETGAELAPALAHDGAAISIVVCTHERPDDLERCLEALAPMAAAGHEVLVVDNAPRSGRTAAVAARFPFRYLIEPRQGLDHARNCGLLAASHAIVAYTDDDAVPDPGWAAAIAAPFADLTVGCATGLVMPLELETAAQEQFELYCLGRRTFERRVFGAPATPPSTAGVAGMGANMAVRRELALSLGGFDPRLDGGMPTCSGGDTDMFARVLDARARIVYTPDALVWHRHRRDTRSLNDCIFGYGVGLYSFLTKRVIEQRDMGALLTGARWWAGPPLKAAWGWLRGRPTPPAGLLLREAAGALLGPHRLRVAHSQLVASAERETYSHGD